MASYFKVAKPRSTVLILDANPDVTSKGPLFKKVWAEQYPGIVEYRGQHKATAVDARSSSVKFEVQGDVKADVLNVLPTMRAGAIAVQDDPMLIAQAGRIADLAMRHQLPMIGFVEYARDGGLLAFGVNLPDLWRRAAGFVDKILKGAEPADLPVEQPTSSTWSST